MNKKAVVALFLLGAAMGDAMADCSSPRVNTITALLNNKLVCGQAPSGGDQWQEEHRGGGGVLWERAKGPTDPVDPSHQVGTWSQRNVPPGNNREVCYDYGSGGTYCFSVHANTDGSYSFCSGTTESARGTIIAIPAPAANACGFY